MKSSITSQIDIPVKTVKCDEMICRDKEKK